MSALATVRSFLPSKPYNLIRLFHVKLPVPIVLRNLDDIVTNHIEVLCHYEHPHMYDRQYAGIVRNWRFTKEAGLQFEVRLYKFELTKWIDERDVLQVLTANVRIEPE